jgi:hypothetical protein
MHEQVYQRASHQQQVGECRKNMSPVGREEIGTQRSKFETLYGGVGRQGSHFSA